MVDDDDGTRRARPGPTRSACVGVGGRIPLGYYKDPEKTAATFRTVDGVRYSIPGDYATVDADGTIRLLGRGSACINTGGEKVYPEEVELALREHPGVFDCVVVGVPDERFGEMVVALVQVAPGHSLDEAELVAWCRARLAGYKSPRRFLFVDSLSRSAAGKAQHQELRALAVQLLADALLAPEPRPTATSRQAPRASGALHCSGAGAGTASMLRPDPRDAVASGALGVVERGVGRGHQPLGVARVVGHRRHAGADRHRRLAHRAGDAVAHAFGDPHRVLAGAPGQEHDELVAAVASGDVEVLGVGDERVGDLTQHRVAGQVPVGVVHLLEVVDVEHEQAQRRAEALGPRRPLAAATRRTGAGWRAR